MLFTCSKRLRDFVVFSNKLIVVFIVIEVAPVKSGYVFVFNVVLVACNVACDVVSVVSVENRNSGGGPSNI